MTRFRRCFMCDKTTKDKVVLHKFPNRNSPYYSAWVEFCRMALCYIKEDDDFSSSYICSMHFKESDYRLPKILEMGAVPSVLHIKNYFDSYKCSAPPKSTDIIIETSSVMGPISTTSTSATSPAEGLKTCEEIPSDPLSTKEKFLFGKFSSADMSSPKKAELCFMMAKSVIDRKNKELKVLRQKNRRLVNRVHSLKNVVNHLKSALISEEAVEVILGS